MKYNYTQHLFMPNQTIVAVLKLHNNMTTNELDISGLIAEFNRVNNNTVPRVGVTFQIPVIINEQTE